MKKSVERTLRGLTYASIGVGSVGFGLNAYKALNYANDATAARATSTAVEAIDPARAAQLENVAGEYEQEARMTIVLALGSTALITVGSIVCLKETRPEKGPAPQMPPQAYEAFPEH